MRRLAPAALAGATLLLAAAATDPARRVLDDFDDVARWTAAPSDGVRLALSSEAGESGNALRMDFDFAGHAGWAAVRRKLSLDLPANYEFTFRIRGEAPVNNLEFKLVDESGENVWWTNRRDFEFPRDWRKITVKKRHLGFAWGPAGGGELRRAASLEITVTAGTGGKGSVWLDELTFEELPPARPYTRQPEALASSDRPEHHWSLAVDGDGATSWQSETADAGEWMAIDFIERREYGGLSIDWEDNGFADAYAVEISDDAREWTTVREVVDGNGGRDYIFLPESESRYVRVRATRSGKGRFFGVREIAAEALEVGASENAFFERIAKDAPRASFPRSFSGEQSYWTVVGVDGDSEEALFSEDGALEPGKSSFSIEPFLRMDGALVGWDGVSTLQSLAEGDLPVPTVTRSRRGVTLETTAFAAGEPGRSTLYARYRIRNTGRARKSLDLFLAIRPFQVNPPSQFLNSPGGVARVRSIDRKGGSITVDGRSLVVLFWGIVTALLLRAGMILGGTALLQKFHWLIYVFGAFLLLTGVKLFFHEEEEHHPERSWAFRFFRRIIPTTHRIEGHHFFLREAGKWVATPLFLALILIEVSDVVFALDSIPAIFGVTLDPFIVFTSNIFAILGLRSLYFAVAQLLGRFEYLKVGLSAVLVFIGAKMLASGVVHVHALVSLAVVVALLGGSILLSLMKTRRLAEPEGPA